MDPITTLALGAGAKALTGGISSYLGSKAASKAAKAQADAARAALEFQRGVYNKAETQLNPYIETGTGLLQDYTTKLRDFRQPEFNFQKKEFDINNWKDPGYDFRLSEAQRILDASNAKKGISLGSGAQKSLQQRSQDLASQEFQNSYERYAKERQFDYDVEKDKYARNLGFTKDELQQYYQGQGIGKDSATALATIGGNQGPQIASSLESEANAKAQGVFGQAGQWQNLFNNIGDMGAALGYEYYKGMK